MHTFSGKVGDALGTPSGPAFRPTAPLKETLVSDKIRVGDIMVPSNVEDLS